MSSSSHVFGESLGSEPGEAELLCLPPLRRQNAGLSAVLVRSACAGSVAGVVSLSRFLAVIVSKSIFLRERSRCHRTSGLWCRRGTFLAGASCHRGLRGSRRRLLRHVGGEGCLEIRRLHGDCQTNSA